MACGTFEELTRNVELSSYLLNIGTQRKNSESEMKGRRSSALSLQEQKKRRKSVMHNMGEMGMFTAQAGAREVHGGKEIFPVREA